MNGASGGVGTLLVQACKALGAEVYGVCSGANQGMVKGLGANEVSSALGCEFWGVEETDGGRSSTTGNITRWKNIWRKDVASSRSMRSSTVRAAKPCTRTRRGTSSQRASSSPSSAAGRRAWCRS